MIRLKQYNQEGKKLEPIKLTDEIFNKKINLDLLHQSVVSYLSNKRQSIANTKTKGDVAGSNIKPFRQKGTGRARAGLKRSPVWVGGGITFGPTKDRNFHLNFPKKMKKSAFLQALLTKINEKRLLIVDKLNFKKIKTKDALNFLQSFSEIEGNILLVIDNKDKNIELSFRNLPYIHICLGNNLNALDVLKYQWIIMTVKSLDQIKDRLIIKKTIQVKDQEISEKALIKTKTNKVDIKKIVKKKKISPKKTLIKI